MTTVTSLTADRMLAIEAASVVDGDVVGGNLILTKHDGSQINAGPVTGPTGPQGPQGALLPVISGVPVLDVGLANQIRAGRQLTAADFTNMGLSAPLGLWNLSDLSDVSGNGRNLLNKGAVPFDVGINGAAASAAKFVGSTAQALYIPDTGSADPLRIKAGSLGCWFRTAKFATQQGLISKAFNAAGNLGYFLQVTSANTLQLAAYSDGSNLLVNAVGIINVVDGRWHFGVVTYDGTRAIVYTDGIAESSFSISGTIFGSSGPFNIGSSFADGATATNTPWFDRIDEAFITNDVLSEDQIRNLYCAKIPHTLAVTPSRVSLNVHRRRKGATLAVADFPTQPLRLYNFSGGSLGDEGSNGVGLTNNGGAVNVGGVDGSTGNSFNFNGAQNLSATDAGLPSGVATCSYGFWFKTIQRATNQVVMMYGTAGPAARETYIQAAGIIMSVTGNDSISGPFVADGLWHFMCVVEDNTAADGIKRKQYIDSRLVGISTGFSTITPIGANSFRIGVEGASNAPFFGQIDGVFICDYALTAERIAQLYAKGSQTLASSPKNPGDHVEAMSTSSLLATFDTLESQHTIDLGVEP